MMVDCCELRTSVHCPFLAVFWFVFRFGVWVVRGATFCFFSRAILHDYTRIKNLRTVILGA